ncbi:MAG: TonB-dependent receptor [Tsuneonella suprasediminis]|uniref:TonB-dependent receptor n=1 Tax=Altericroceibacterium spongiae TaxID=2320269 RepID=UPI001EE5BDF2|nr:TonB-dependent receptor [Altericroceibacterium spongiae]|tara:strand:+ start:148 stop:858 length:711 start_codon:yes stop_codon:yes gene_type:complete
MAAMALPGASEWGATPPRAARSSTRFGQALAVIGVGLILVLGYMFWGGETVSERPNEVKTTRVILPPPPPPPPETQPQEKPPEPVDAPPIEEPVDTPPPPDQAQSSDPAPGDNALTAREGAGPSNYGLAGGDGTGTRIGGRPGGSGNGFAAYANVALAGIRAAAQRDDELSRGRYSVQLAVTVNAAGKITNVRVLSGGSDRRNARIREVLTGLQLSQRPPDGLPVMRIELNARSGA